MDVALDKAVRIFSERGYSATSIGDLTDAMELASGSVYKAFKDKRAVFLAAFDRYKSMRDKKLGRAIRADCSGRDKLRDALEFYADASQGAEGGRGCLVIGSAVELASRDREIAMCAKTDFRRNEAVLAEIIREGQADGSIQPRIDAAAVARLLVCLTQGLRVTGKTGRSRAELATIVDTAMRLVD